MARYTGPKTKIARKFGEAIYGEDKVLAKKNYPPGQHGANAEERLRNMAHSSKRSRKLNTHMVCSSVSSATSLRKQPHQGYHRRGASPAPRKPS